MVAESACPLWVRSGHCGPSFGRKPLPPLASCLPCKNAPVRSLNCFGCCTMGKRIGAVGGTGTAICRRFGHRGRPAHDQEIAEIVDAAVADWSVLLSCLVLDTEGHGQPVRIWEEERLELAQVLAVAALEPELAADIASRLATEQLMVLTNGDVSTMVAYCAETEWVRRMITLDFVQVTDEVVRVLQPG